MWITRFLRRNATAAVIGSIALFALITTPILVPSLGIYVVLFWFAAGLLAFIAATVLARSFVRMKAGQFAEREQYARQTLRSELLLELRNARNTTLKEITQLSTKHEQLSTKHEQLSKLCEQLSNNPTFNLGDFQLFNRRLKKEHVSILLNDWAGKLDLKMTPKSLAYLAHRVCFLESKSKGRFATSIENLVLRILVAAAVKEKNLRVLEIGTLFGIGLTAIYEHCKPRFDSVQLTAIDPLDGYYGTDVRDVLTDEPISELIFRENLATAGVAEKDCTLIKGKSSEVSTIGISTAMPLHDVLIIDGDHSYEGVKADFINYLPSVKVGGYIIFDDYGASEWPGVKEFVDEGVHKNPELMFIGESWRTAVFQVIKR